MSSEKEIADIVAQLQRLQLQQSELLQRITQVSEENNTNAAQQANAPREFAICDRVRIINPNRFQANRGRIIKIGPSRITVLTENGTKINRAAKNLILEE
jgi:seryl-tRNA synthetase